MSKLPQKMPGPDGFGERKVTIFLGTKKHEASWVKVSRGPHAQYKDACIIEFKPKSARNLRRYVETSKPKTVIVEGWGHPEFDWLLRSIGEAPEVELGPGVTFRTVSKTYFAGQEPVKDKYEIEFEEYIKGLDPSRILLDTRGRTVVY